MFKKIKRILASSYIKSRRTFVLSYAKKDEKYNESVDMKNVLDNKEFRKQFLSDKNNPLPN